MDCELFSPSCTPHTPRRKNSGNCFHVCQVTCLGFLFSPESQVHRSVCLCFLPSHPQALCSVLCSNKMYIFFSMRLHSFHPSQKELMDSWAILDS